MPLLSNKFGLAKKAVGQLCVIALLTAVLVFASTPPAAEAMGHTCVDWTDYSADLGMGPKTAGTVVTLTDVESSGVDMRITWINAARPGAIVDTSSGGDFTEVLDYATLLGSSAATPSVFRYWADLTAGGHLTFEFLETGTTTPVDLEIESVLAGGQRRFTSWGVSEIALSSGGTAVASTYANPDLSGTDTTAGDGLTGIGTTPIIELNQAAYGSGNVSAYNETRDSYVVVGPDTGESRDWTVLDWGGVSADTLTWKLYGQTSATQPDPETADLPHANHAGLSAYISGLCFTPPPVSAPAPSIDIEKDTNGVQADGASDTGPLVPVGDVVTWTFVVTNDGDTDLADVVVGDVATTDNGTAPGTIVCDWAASSDAATPDRNLSVGETVSCTAASIAVAGQYRNNSDVAGTPVADATTADPDNPVRLTDLAGDDLVDVTDEDSSAYFGSAPSIDIEKITNTVQADTGSGPNIGVGSDVLWTFVVTNNGSVDLAGVVVADSVTTDNGTDIGVVACDWAASSDTATPDRNLSVGETVSCTSSGTAKIGQHKNNSTVSGTPVANATTADPDNPTALTDGAGVALEDPTDEDPSAYFGAVFDLALTKQLSDGSNSALVSIGENVTFVLTVINQGNTSASDIEVVDYIPEGLKLNDPDWVEANSKATTTLAGVVLEPGASTTVDITFTVQPGATALTNTAEISNSTATDAAGQTIMETLTTGTLSALVDADSVADDTDTESPIDDVVDNAGGDEDDHDGAVLSIRAAGTPGAPLAVTGNETSLPVTIAFLLMGLGSLLVVGTRRLRLS